MRTIVLLLLLALFAGCTTQRRCLRKFPPVTSIEIRDSIVERDTTIFRDRVFYDTILGDTLYVDRNIPVELKLKPLTVENDYSKAIAWVEAKKLRLSLIQKEQVITRIVENAEKETRHWKEMYHSKEVTETVEVKYIPTVYKWSLRILIGLIVLGIGWLVVKLKF